MQDGGDFAAGAVRALRFDQLVPERTAVLVIDMQNFFVSDPAGVLVPAAKAIVPNINRLTGAFRAAGAQIVFIKHTVSEEPRFALPAWQRDPAYAGGAIALSVGPLQAGQTGHELFAELDVDQRDLVMPKHRYSAFLPNSSDVDAVLRERGIDTLVIIGTTTNICCESSARDASMLDYRVFFPSDANAAMMDDFHNATLLNIGFIFADIRSTDEMMAMLPQRDASEKAEG